MAGRAIPSLMRKWAIKQIGTNFRNSCVLEESAVPSIGPKDILIKNKFVGINASDINLTAGRYDASPTVAGIEGVAEVVKVGSECSRLKEGQAVGHVVTGAFSEYQAIPEGAGLPLPSTDKGYLPLIMSGLGTSIALDTVGQIQPSHTVLVTAAAGGAGQMAVQYAKVKGCHVIGTCSSEKKSEFLKSLGCHRVVNYKEESLGSVLKKEYPKGVNVIFENVGGKLMKAGVNNIAYKGRVILFGFISAYENENMAMDVFPNLGALIFRCASIHGFFLMDGRKHFHDYLQKLISLRDQGQIQTFVDDGGSTAEGTFRGLEDIPRAVEHLYSGKSFGKVVVDIAD